MPYTVTWTDNGVIQKFSGALSYKDIENADNLLFGDYRFDRIKYFIIDLMDVKKTLLESDEMQVVAHTDHVANSYKNTLRVAVACNLQPLIHQLNEYIHHSKMIGNSWSVRIFNDLKSAEDWAKS